MSLLGFRDQGGGCHGRLLSLAMGSGARALGPSLILSRAWCFRIILKTQGRLVTLGACVSKYVNGLLGSKSIFVLR